MTTKIRKSHNKHKTLYYCKLHPDEQNVHLETIEHHCKYIDPVLHKSEILVDELIEMEKEPKEN